MTKDNNICKNCGYEWKPRATESVRCPKCNSKEWKEVVILAKDEAYDIDFSWFNDINRAGAMVIIDKIGNHTEASRKWVCDLLRPRYPNIDLIIDDLYRFLKNKYTTHETNKPSPNP